MMRRSINDSSIVDNHEAESTEGQEDSMQGERDLIDCST